LSAREAPALQHAVHSGAQGVVSLFERCDAFRKPQRFRDMLQCCELAMPAQPLAPAAILLRTLDAAAGVNAGAVAKACGDDKAGIPAAVRAARVAAVGSVLFS